MMFLTIAALFVFTLASVLLIVDVISMFTSRRGTNGIKLLVTIAVWVTAGYFSFDYPMTSIL